MNPALLLLTVFVAALYLPARGFVFNKCCPSGYVINDELECVAASPPLPPDDLSWFPRDALFNASNQVRLTKETQEQVLGWMTRLGEVRKGTFHMCPNLEFSYFLEDYEFFRILVDDAGEKKIEVMTTIPDEETTDAVIDDMWNLPLDEVCLEKCVADQDIHVVIYCPGPSKPWIPKCCPARHLYNASSQSCVPIPPHLRTNITDWKPHNTSGQLGKYFLHVPNGPKFPDCPFPDLLKSVERAKRCRGVVDPDTKYHFLADGTIKASGRVLLNHEYCGDKSWHPGEHIFQQNLIYCGKVGEKSYTKIVYGILFITGGMCLLLTVAISLLLPELRRRIHNKIAITHNATLMVAHFLWGTSQLLPGDKFTLIVGKIAGCTIMSLTIQFTFLGSLFWLNAMCINMSSTFRTTQTLGMSVKSEARRYAVYSLYAWGMTGLISIFTISMEFAETPPFGLLRPGFQCECDFSRNTSAILLYFYGPMAVLLLFNLVLYCFTTWKIISVQKQTSILHHTDSNTTGGSSFQSDKQRLILYTKLFLLMGLTWVTEIIGWAVGGDSFFWTILDIINLLRAVFIFVLFICKKPILRSLRDHVRQATGRLRRSSSTRSTTDAISLSTVGPNSRKASQEESGRKKSRDELKDWVEQKAVKRSSAGAKRESQISEVEETEEFDFLTDEMKNEKHIEEVLHKPT